MILTPARFMCPKHNTDLTTDVTKKVEGRGGIVVSFAFGQRRKKRPRAFLVVVTCTGDGTDPHDLEFKGTMSP